MRKMWRYIAIMGILYFINCGQPAKTHRVGAIVEYPSVASPYKSLRIYQVMVESFIDGDSSRNYNAGYGPSHHKGDIKGIIKALPYIKNLGMNAIWVTPIFDSEKGTPRYNPDLPPDPRLDATGYFTRNYFKIDPYFGTLEDAKKMVKEAHCLGLYVFFDGVFGHNKGHVSPSPSGLTPAGPADHERFPLSTPFFTEVAEYWIDQLEIDGWRLDQAYQVPVEEWHKIRKAVEKKCADRKEQGKQWGTLGYMVGEVFDLAPHISESAFGSEEMPGLLSAFDFPVRYNLVQVLAVEEKGFGHQPASVLREGMAQHAIYPSFAVPNLMLGNHDLVRFGDLIQRARLGNPENWEYWNRHKVALSFLAAYPGPITIYYNEEIGAEVPGFSEQIKDPAQKCWESGLCDDHVSRSSGKISNLTRQEQDLYNYTTQLMQLREKYGLLYDGKTENMIADTEIYMDMKTMDGDTLLYVMNVSGRRQSIRLPQNMLKKKRARELLSGKSISISPEHRIFSIDPLSAQFVMFE